MLRSEWPRALVCAICVAVTASCPTPPGNEGEGETGEGEGETGEGEGEEGEGETGEGEGETGEGEGETGEGEGEAGEGEGEPVFPTEQCNPDVYGTDAVRHWHLEMLPSDFQEMLAHDPFGDEECGTHEYWPANFWVEGDLEATEANPLLVGVRPKHYFAIPETGARKISMKIDVNKFVHGQQWHFLTKLSLENGGDGATVREPIAWNMYQQAGVLAACANWVTVTVNDELLGVYTNVEQMNRPFFQGRLGESSGHAWKLTCQRICAGEVRDDETGLWEGSDPNCVDETRDTLCFDPFAESNQQSCAAPNDLVAVLPSLVDMNQLLRMTAVTHIIANRDGMTTNHNNYWYYNFLSGSRGRVYFPWDLDTVMKDEGTLLLPEDPYTGLFAIAEVRAQYKAVVLELLDGPLTEANVLASFDAAEALIADDVAADPYTFDGNALGGPLPEHIDDLKAWWQQRLLQMRAEAEAL
jgi:hypothetical protein